MYTQLGAHTESAHHATVEDAVSSLAKLKPSTGTVSLVVFDMPERMQIVSPGLVARIAEHREQIASVAAHVYHANEVQQLIEAF